VKGHQLLNKLLVEIRGHGVNWLPRNEKLKMYWFCRFHCGLHGADCNHCWIDATASCTNNDV